MKKKIAILAVIALVFAFAFWAKSYYNERYVLSDYFYTQIPVDEINEDSWLLDSDGVKQEKGKSYTLQAFNASGEERKVTFIKRGTAENYYEPGAYIKVSMSKTLSLGEEVVKESDVPDKALEKIRSMNER